MDKNDKFKNFIQKNTEVVLEKPEDEWRQINQRILKKPATSYFKSWQTIAASIIVVIGFGIYQYQQSQIEMENSVAEFILHSDEYFDSNEIQYDDSFYALVGNTK